MQKQPKTLNTTTGNTNGNKMLNFIFSLIIYFIGSAISKVFGHTVCAIVGIVAGFLVYPVYEVGGLTLIAISTVLLLIKIVFDRRDKAKRVATYYPPDACEDPIFLGLRFGMSEAETERAAKTHEHISYGYNGFKYTLCEGKVGNVTFDYCQMGLYKVTIKFPDIRDNEIDSIIHKNMIEKGYKRYGIFLFGYCYTKKNIVVSLSEESADYAGKERYTTIVEYLNAPIAEEIKSLKQK